MQVDVNVNVSGLEGIASAINGLAEAINSASLGTSVSAMAAVAKVQEESKTGKKAAAVEDASPKTSSQGASAASAESPASKSTTGETAAQSTVSTDAHAPTTDSPPFEADEPANTMTEEALRVVAAEALKRDKAAVQALVTEYGGAVSKVPAEKRQELASKLLNVGVAK